MDTLHINSLRVSTKIGVHAWEQRIDQLLLIDISIPVDFSTCDDKLENTLDYDALCKSVSNLVTSRSFQLIETVANTVAEHIKQAFQVKEVRVAISKPHAVPNAGGIQVVAVR